MFCAGWATPEARLGLLCLLKVFPVLGRFPAPAEIPPPVVAFLAKRAELGSLTLGTYPKRTRIRHHLERRQYLGIQAWSEAGVALARQTMQRLVCGRAHLSDMINGAIDALMGARHELPALSMLRRLAGHVQATAHNA